MISLTSIYNIVLFVPIYCRSPHLDKTCGHGLPNPYFEINNLVYTLNEIVFCCMVVFVPMQIHIKQEIRLNLWTINNGINVA